LKKGSDDPTNISDDNWKRWKMQTSERKQWSEQMTEGIKTNRKGIRRTEQTDEKHLKLHKSAQTDREKQWKA
jgi:hypothetical protein